MNRILAQQDGFINKQANIKSILRQKNTKVSNQKTLTLIVVTLTVLSTHRLNARSTRTHGRLPVGI